MCNDPRYAICIRNFSFRKRLLPLSFLKFVQICANRVHYSAKTYKPYVIENEQRKHLPMVGKDKNTYFEFVPKDYFYNCWTILEDAGYHPEDVLFRIPCRKCLGCLADRRNSWTKRVFLESSLYKHNSFVTLTYSDENVPPTLIRKHFQDFMKRLREKCARTGRPSPRMFYRGEYGDKKGRPHFHAILLNYEPTDLKPLYYITKRGKKVYHYVQGATQYSSSEELSKLWKHGFVIHAPVVRQSVRYVANYLDKGYSWLTQDGTVAVPPFNGYSTRPALGLCYFDKKSALYEGRKALFDTCVPYFRRKLKELEPEEYIEIQREAEKIARGRIPPWSRTSLSETEYLKQREERMGAQLQKFGRKFEASISLDPFSGLQAKRNKASPPVVR